MKSKVKNLYKNMTDQRWKDYFQILNRIKLYKIWSMNPNYKLWTEKTIK